jgi:hypothetical protein
VTDLGPLPPPASSATPFHEPAREARLHSKGRGAWFLILQEPTGEVNRIEIDAELRLGRNPDCELLLSDPQASRLHARLRPTPDGVLLTDEGSTNGTRVNGKRIRGSALLRDGDTIAIGGIRLRIVAPL